MKKGHKIFELEKYDLEYGYYILPVCVYVSVICKRFKFL